MSDTRKVLAAAGLLLLIFSLSSLSAAPPDGAGDHPVTVINRASQPVPTAAQGTTQVSGTVQVANSPTVHLAAGTAVSLDGVVSVRSADAAQPVRLALGALGGNGGNDIASNVYTVPAGKRLVIEDLSAKAFLHPGDAGELTMSLEGFERYVPLASAGVIVNRQKLVAGEHTHLEASAGEHISFELIRSDTVGDYSFKAGLSGYLVDSP